MSPPGDPLSESIRDLAATLLLVFVASLNSVEAKKSAAPPAEVQQPPQRAAARVDPRPPDPDCKVRLPAERSEGCSDELSPDGCCATSPRTP